MKTEPANDSDVWTLNELDEIYRAIARSDRQPCVTCSAWIPSDEQSCQICGVDNFWRYEGAQALSIFLDVRAQIREEASENVRRLKLPPNALEGEYDRLCKAEIDERLNALREAIRSKHVGVAAQSLALLHQLSVKTPDWYWSAIKHLLDRLSYVYFGAFYGKRAIPS